METAIPVATSIPRSPVSSTGHALYTAFGQPPSEEPRDPSGEHGD
uniref:Photosystem II protein N n=4 Tax=Selaginella TaxID=3246 RepID=A0A482CF08_9TRAC|nr:photosystem II protein N [Selaginella uncinata]YP_009589396.1 photosystem II protein N [Selaginella bisulcata]YP_009589539.1 photosystem II protein N [Selaginella hainanensis]YP_009589617.1 photosystem II protein N [Selaginella pennata]QBL07895.1 photosystem II protein N [Selaginella uncinata]QBL75979.1 photosystem II protein N [Selaginella bisulcata]QBL76120.1 photosystem II protein N [Selaginella hainanensis]QBL76200.1 photosystem II protein N [Selaginella pennata]